jgi:acetolactate synthase-1/3 small subunit
MAATFHTISVFVENTPGVLVRIAGLFVRRGFNIESIAAGPTEHPEYTRITIVVRLESKPVEQVLKQVQKLLPVIDARELQAQDRVDRELLLIRAQLPPGGIEQAHAVVRNYHARIVDVSDSTFLVEATSTPEEIDALVALLSTFGVQEMARTGRISLERRLQAPSPLSL